MSVSNAFWAVSSATRCRQLAFGSAPRATTARLAPPEASWASALSGSSSSPLAITATHRHRVQLRLKDARLAGRVGGRRPELTRQQQQEIISLVAESAYIDSLALLVRLHEPEPLVHAACDFGQNIRTDGILELVHFVDAEPRSAGECGKRRGQCIDMLIARFQDQWVDVQSGALGYDAGRAFGNAAQLRDALGNKVDVVFDRVVDLVKKLVERDKVRALQVLVGLLALGLEVNTVGEPLIEQVCDLSPGRRRQVILGAIELGGRGGALGGCGTTRARRCRCFGRHNVLLLI
tara:strand:- start:537 stop:1412 length:876 start_codon:yes stop_codon:yes gene_type:complete